MHFAIYTWSAHFSLRNFKNIYLKLNLLTHILFIYFTLFGMLLLFFFYLCLYIFIYLDGHPFSLISLFIYAFFSLHNLRIEQIPLAPRF